MLVLRQLPFRQFEFLPVYIQENKPRIYQGSNLERLMYATINGSVSSLPEPQIILRSKRPFAVENTFFQALSTSRTFTVSTVADGPQTLLQSNSIRIVERAFPIAKDVAVARFYAQCQKDSKYSSPQHRDFQPLVSVITMDDVAVDVDRSIKISPSSMRLTIREEIDRVMQISEYFIQWCIKKYKKI